MELCCGKVTHAPPGLMQCHCQIHLNPSLCVHAACSSSFVALNDAISDIRAGVIDYAVVGGASAILRPQTSLAFAKLNMLSPEARPSCFLHK